MEGKIDVLEAMFNKAEADIDYISNKLDADFANADSAENKKNPAEVLEKLSKVKEEYAEIVKEAAAIQQAQKDAMEFFRDQLTTTCQALMKLQMQSGMPTEPPAELLKVEEMLGVASSASLMKFTQTAAGDAAPQTAAATPPNTPHTTDDDDTYVLDPSIPPLPNTPRIGTVEAAASPCLSPAERRKETSEFIELEKEEFESVSELTRRRVKLPEVNQVYRILWKHFKEEQNSDPLTPQDMFKMGLRVSGQTGEAKLKVLKALKLLTLTKKGEVQLV